VNWLDWLGMGLIAVGAFFFLAGTVGLLRLPDIFSRLHAVTKADNLGLGFTVAGLAVQSGSGPLLLKLGFIWLLALLASSTVCFLVASNLLGNAQRRKDDKPSQLDI
jgi:multicomponent Na+:H+ antiporter subunit G